MLSHHTLDIDQSIFIEQVLQMIAMHIVYKDKMDTEENELVGKGIELVSYCMSSGDINVDTFIKFKFELPAKLASAPEIATAGRILTKGLLNDAATIRFSFLNFFLTIVRLEP